MISASTWYNREQCCELENLYTQILLDRQEGVMELYFSSNRRYVDK